MASPMYVWYSTQVNLAFNWPSSFLFFCCLLFLTRCFHLLFLLLNIRNKPILCSSIFGVRNEWPWLELLCLFWDSLQPTASPSKLGQTLGIHTAVKIHSNSHQWNAIKKFKQKNRTNLVNRVSCGAQRKRINVRTCQTDTLKCYK